jgi:hypothetical protein
MGQAVAVIISEPDMGVNVHFADILINSEDVNDTNLTNDKYRDAARDIQMPQSDAASLCTHNRRFMVQSPAK